MVYQDELSFSTSGYGDMHNLTDNIHAILAKSGIHAGIVTVFAVGSTAGICAIEYEPGLERDLPTTLSKLIPPSRSY